MGGKILKPKCILILILISVLIILPQAVLSAPPSSSFKSYLDASTNQVLTYAENEAGNILVDVSSYNPNMILTRTEYTKEGIGLNTTTQEISSIINGYIVQFKETPLFVYKTELEKNIKERETRLANSHPVYKYTLGLIESAAISYDKSTVSSKVNDQRNKIRNLGERIKEQIKTEKGVVSPLTGRAAEVSDEQKEGAVLGEYEEVFSGIAVNISEEEAQLLKKLDYVKEVYPNNEVRSLLMDSVPLINADDVWSLGYTGKDTTIAIIDTGIDYTHPDLGGCFGSGCKVVGGYDFVNGDNDPMDDHGHGTHCAGIAAGNGTLKGVAPDAKLYAYKVLNSGGSGSMSTVIAGIERATDPNQDGDYSDHAGVISMSLGGWGDPDDPLSQAVDNAVEVGTVVVVAAGNSGPYEETISSPGTARKAITVGATDKTDTIAYFSSRGPVKWKGGSIIKPDVVAPGVNICSAQWDDAWSAYRCFDDRHVAISGTSMATPHVAGAVALLKQKNPSWTPTEIKMALRNTAIDLGYDTITQGYGRIDALKAIELTNAPPIAMLNTSGTFNGVVDILGAATSNNFESYTVYYGEGYRPASWVEVCSSNNQVVYGVLCTFDASTIKDGTYILRLSVKDTTGQISDDKTVMTINNYQLTNPLNNDILRAGDLIEINGTIKDPRLENYIVEYGLGENPTVWLTTGITLTGATYPIENGILANWDTSSIKEANFYTVRVSFVVGGVKNEEFAKNIYLDPSLKEGWPKKIEYEKVACWDDPTKTCYDWAGLLEPVVSDIDNDGYNETIVYIGGDPPKLSVFKSDGSLYWSRGVGTTEAPGGNLHIPLVGDVNKDGFDEIIAYNFKEPSDTSELYCFNHFGEVVFGPVSVPKDYHPTMLLADLNLDGNKEVVIKGNEAEIREKMVIVDSAGKILSKWYLPNRKVGILGGPDSYPAIGNFDDDPELEIVSASPSENADYDWNTGTWINEGVIYVYNMDGSVVTGWPVYVPGMIFSSPAVGDINSDDNLEIVVGLIFAGNAPDTRYGGVYAFDKRGNVLSGWPFEKGWNFESSPSLADFDKDGDLEIVASRLGFVTYVVHHNGTKATGWPQSTNWNDYYSTIAGDVDGNGAPDVITTAGNGFYPSIYYYGGVYGWNSGGTALEGFPKVTEEDAQAPAVVADIDKDGKTELLASSDWDKDWQNKIYKYRGSVYAWEMDKTYNSATMEWPTFHHDKMRTGLYGYEEEIIEPNITCSIPSSPNCNVSTNCQCNVTICQNGWLRARMPDKTEVVKYFSSGTVSFNTGSVTGAATGYISCIDDKKEYVASINVKA